MFTGIVIQRARVESRSAAEAAGPDAPLRLRLRLEREMPGLRVGDSIAVDGVCLTVVDGAGATLAFDVVPESLRRTTLSRLRPGDAVNVEPALRAGDVLGGHLVQGHVDGVGTVQAVESRGGDVRMTIALPQALRGATIPKGSIAVDGVSLTVGESADGWFSVYLIPHTLEVTGLAAKRPGDPVNLEADVVGRYVEHHVRRLLGKEAPAATPGGAPGV